MSSSHPVHKLVLKWAKMITSNVRHLAFMREDGSPFHFEPGQFITIQWENAQKKIKRSYTIASIPGQDETLDIALSYVKGGLGTELLFNLQPGQSILATGPHGKLVLQKEQPSRDILVATGTGIAPYRAMLPELVRRIEVYQQKTCVMLGVRSREDSLYSNDFLNVASKHQDHFQYNVYYSRENPADARSHEHHGYVQNDFEQLNLNPTNDIVYLCGNPNMIDHAFELLKNKGFNSQRVRREKYFSSK